MTPKTATAAKNHPVPVKSTRQAGTRLAKAARVFKPGQWPAISAPMTNAAAYILRENTGTTGLEQTALAAIAILAEFDIPHLIVGGVAVQEHGYERVTLDVDIVVPDVIEAVEFLTADLSGPFVKVAGVEDRVEDRRNGVCIDFLPAGRVLKRGCRVPFPQPSLATDQLQIVSLAELVALKLDSWAHSPVRRHKDKTDVIELIMRRRLRRDLVLPPAVRDLYCEIWEELRQETD